MTKPKDPKRKRQRGSLQRFTSRRDVEEGRAPGAKLTDAEKLAQGFTWKPCRKCDKDFLSAGDGNRICAKCRAANVFERERRHRITLDRG